MEQADKDNYDTSQDLDLSETNSPVTQSTSYESGSESAVETDIDMARITYQNVKTSIPKSQGKTTERKMNKNRNYEGEEEIVIEEKKKKKKKDKKKMLEQSLNKEEEVSLGGSNSKKEVLIISKDNAQKQSSKAKKSQSNDQGGNTESAEPSHYELEIVKNVIDIKGFTVRWHSKKTKDVFIHENICKVCDQKCNNEAISSCYICSIQAHFPCIAENNPRMINQTKSFKWFCDSCSNMSFHKVTTAIGSKLVEMASEKFSGTTLQKNEVETETSRDIPQHFPSFQNSLSNKVKEVVASELSTFIKREVLCSLSESLKAQNREGSVDIIPKTNGVWGSKLFHKDKNQSVQVFDQSKSSVEGIVDTCTTTTKAAIHSGNDRVDPDLSLIIQDVKARKYKNSSNCKSEFNKHFVRMRIKSIFATQAGNIIVELYEKEDVLTVVRDWKPSFFSSEEFCSVQGTKVVRMESSGKQKEIVLKVVNKSWSDDDIKSELQSDHNGFTNPSVKRFITRDGKVLGTIKINFQTHQDFTKAMARGVFLYSEHINAEAFIHQPRAHQCYNCRQFGHPAKWCAKKQVCEYCAMEGHSGKDCIMKGEIHDYVCVNCKGQHSATYHKCPIYIKNLRRPTTPYVTAHE